MKVFYDKDEWYPVYTIREEFTGYGDINLPPKFIKEFNEALKKFNRFQELLTKKIKEQKKE